MILRGARLRAGVLRARLPTVRDPAELPATFFTGLAVDLPAPFFVALLRAGRAPATLPVVFLAAAFLVATFLAATFLVAPLFAAAFFAATRVLVVPAFPAPARDVACFVAEAPAVVLRAGFVVLAAAFLTTFFAVFFAVAFFATFLAGAFFVAALLAVLRATLRVFAVAMRCSTYETWHRDNTQDLQRR